MDDHPKKSGAEPISPYYSFQLSEDYLSQAEIDSLKQRCDAVADDALLELQELSKNRASGTRLDLYSTLEQHHDAHPSLRRLWNEVYHVPDWVDWAQLERGQKTFWRYGFANLIGFALQGFMGGNAATPGIAEVLVRTGGFSANVVLRRALETFQGLLQVTRCLQDLKPTGAGHTSLIRIRLLHAMVRARILNLRETDQSYFDVDQYGLPINTCDDVHTIALFACNPMWIELPAMGLEPRSDEIVDYIALFRYIAYVLGVPNEYFATAAEARRVMEAMCVHECVPNETSRVLCHNFIVALKDVPPVNLSAGFIAAASRKINGPTLSDALGAGIPTAMDAVTFRGFCWLARSLVFLQRLSPTFDDLMINLQREVLYAYIVEGNSSKFCLGGASKFDMKYVPRLGKRTGKGHPHGARSGSGFLFRPLEFLFLTTFVLGCCLGPALLVFSWKIWSVISTPPQQPNDLTSSSRGLV
ncbi:hypothetical protein PRZ48_005748 [Zasmidium cellare]|uniref:ER-bound oxygenase mpaB/mpaB'/Rubber oxygenase catalytic domain-containing protein n=1 Tax=Zasmidium cellare TaxID=395010 RepID=A0ABR0EM89_ZASCE|nr:hypothetical protein PRZ48_005748 [Zasmidium cellare]